MSEGDLISISLINHYTYCPRRAALIIQEQEFEDNVHTLKGSQLHENVDREWALVVEGVRVEYALPVWSDRLGLIGKCDVVEFWSDGNIYPVEYKKGRKKRWLNDDLQLTAQAMCLEEMLNTSVRKGAIFYYESRRRREVIFTSHLREEVERIVGYLRLLLHSTTLPPPINNYKCVECSLHDLCFPELIGKKIEKEWRDSIYKVE